VLRINKPHFLLNNSSSPLHLCPKTSTMALMHRHRHIARLSAAPTARLLTLGGLLVGFAVRLYRLGHESLWYDETVSVYLARLPLNTMISHTAGDIHPPGYYGLLHLWHSLTQPSLAHGLEFLYAWPSVVFGLLALPLLLVIARRLFGQRTAVAALWLAAFNPFLVWYSQEVRMYTLGAALGLLCLWGYLAVATPQPECTPNVIPRLARRLYLRRSSRPLHPLLLSFLVDRTKLDRRPLNMATRKTRRSEQSSVHDSLVRSSISSPPPLVPLAAHLLAANH
jgi:hypothetical protein